MISFKVIEESLHHPDVGIYTAFGICAYHDKSGKHVVSVSDVFLNRNDAEALVQRCNIFGSPRRCNRRRNRSLNRQTGELWVTVLYGFD